MNCPSCKMLVDSGAPSCNFCGQDLTLLNTIQKITSDLSHAQEAVDQSVKQLGKITEQARALEQIVLKHTASKIPMAKKIDETPGKGVPSPAVPPPPIFPSPATPKPPQKSARNVERNLGQKWFLVIGVILTVVGIGYFLKYSFDQNWIGPAGRVAMAYLASAGLLMAGESFRKKNLETFGYTLISGGIASLYFSNYAGFQIYALISQATAFALMILVTVLGCALALVHNNKWISVLSIVGGFLTPLLLSTGISNQVVLMTYLGILDLGILLIVLFKRWRVLTYLGFVLTWLYFSGWYPDSYFTGIFWRTLIFLNLFFVIYAVAPFLYYLRKRDAVSVLDFGFTFPNGFIALAFSYIMIEDYTALPMTSLVSVLYSVLFLTMGTHLYRTHPENKIPLLLLLSKGILFLVVTVPLLFDGRMVTLFWTLQAVCLMWVALKINNRWLSRASVALLCLAAGLFVIDHSRWTFVRFFNAQVNFADRLVERSVTLTTVLGGFLVSGILSLKHDQSIGKQGRFLMTGFLVLLLYFLSGEVSLFFETYAVTARQAALSVFWALFAIAIMFVGFSRKIAALRKGAIALFAVAVAKVVFIDMRSFGTPYRIISFIVLGLMLLGASYLYYRQKEGSAEGQTHGSAPTGTG